MSTLSLDRELQERLREASAIGDLDEVRALVDSGVNVNSQNEINGWTCLHWACKRNHKHVVAYLLNSGADRDILTAKDELAAQLTSKAEIKRLLGVEVEDVPEAKEPELPIVPNYLSNPPFIYSKIDREELILAHVTRNGDGTDEQHDDPATLSPTQEEPRQQQPSLLCDVPGPRDGPFIPVAEQNGVVNGALPMELSTEPHPGGHVLSQNGAVRSPLPSPAVPQGFNCAQAGGSMPAFQPFFFTSTFPVNVQELVLKVRIQNPNARENDFIEVELDRQELTYRSLLRVCCRELDISAEHVEKIRKLPNTMLRKDKDVARLQDFQELEVVLEKAEGLSLFSAGAQSGLADRPCYNMKASRLTY
ncbi:ankyrin repeat domain-containing protein 40 [Denticeps clupeoides]|uniref:Ankyrin repeat domain 40 n=1 Tax=Denticeps clupeoides TaxID=299321 RepID=A0AAY4BZV2_9TELE|nr:ankyrin repeat domain-containing protein 40 [Denticeps clupeoides]